MKFPKHYQFTYYEQYSDKVLNSIVYAHSLSLAIDEFYKNKYIKENVPIEFIVNVERLNNKDCSYVIIPQKYLNKRLNVWAKRNLM